MGTILRIALQFGEHVEVPTMGSQKYVAGQSTQHRKGMLEILNDAGVAYEMAGCSDEVVLRPKTRTADDDDIPHRLRWTSWKVSAQRPRGTSARMAGGFVGCQCHTAQAYRVSVMENAIYVYRSIFEDVRRRRQEVCPCAGFNDAHVTVHHHALRMCLANHLRRATHAIGMRLAVEEDIGVIPMKP